MTIWTVRIGRTQAAAAENDRDEHSHGDCHCNPHRDSDRNADFNANLVEEPQDTLAKV